MICIRPALVRLGTSFLPLLIILSLIGLGSCANPVASTPKAPVTLTGVGWVAENIDPSFWSTSASGRMYQNFWINYSGNLSAADVKSAKVYLPGGQTWWTINAASDLNDSKKQIGSYGRWNWSSDSRALPLGTLKATVEFSNGSSASVDFAVSQPGSSSAGGFTAVVSEDTQKAYAAGTTVVAIRRPTAVTFTKLSSLATVTFSLNDDRIFNGWIWFYDSSKNYLGMLSSFRDKTTGAASPLLNAGGGLKTQGTNSIVFTPSALTPGSSSASAEAAFAATTQCVVVVSDGGQYSSLGTGHYLDYDYRAISAFASY